MLRFLGLLAPQILLALPLSLLSLPASSQDSDLKARTALAASILGDKIQEDIEEAMAQATSRLLFSKLSPDPAWGPEHATWQKLLPAFTTEFKNLRNQLLPGSDDRLQTTLATALTQEELAEIDAMLKSTLSVEGDRLLRQHGIDRAFSLYMTAVTTMPALYSQAEKKAMRQKILKLKASEGELAALKPRLEAALVSGNTQAFDKYRQLLGSAISTSEFVRRMDSDDSVKQAMSVFLTGWQARVMQE